MVSWRCRSGGLDGPWTPGGAGGRRRAQVRLVTRSRLPYRPRGRATARGRPFAPRCTAPWLGAPGRVAAVRRRVGAQRPAPNGPFTITAPRASPSWRGGQRQLPEGRCREPATARFGPLLQRGASGSQPESERSSLARAPASHQLLRLRGTSPPRTLRSTLLAPRLQPQFLSKSPANVSHARPDCSLRSRLPKDRTPPPKGQAPSSPPSAAGAPALGSGPGRAGLWGRIRPRDLSPAGVRSPPRLPTALCVHATNPSAEPVRRRRRLARKSEGKGERGTTRGLEGGKRRQHSLWEGSGMLLPLGFFVVSPLPWLPRPARAGAKRDGGGAEPQGTRWKWCFRSCREGA